MYKEIFPKCNIPDDELNGLLDDDIILNVKANPNRNVRNIHYYNKSKGIYTCKHVKKNYYRVSSICSMCC